MTEKTSPFTAPRQPSDEWLARAEPEPALDPDLPIIDPHVHFWVHSSGHRYFLEEFAHDVADCGHFIEATVFVECNAMYRKHGPKHSQSLGETEFVVGQAAMADSGRYTLTRAAAGIVAFVDLTLGDQAADIIDAQVAVANGRLRGIRQRAKWDADPAVRGAFFADAPGLYLRPDFSRGIDVLASRGLLFEASVFHPQIPDVTALARAHPDCRIVLNHTGSPVTHSSYASRKDDVYRKWLLSMRDLAACPNAFVKMGGLLMCLGNFDFTSALRPPTSTELETLWQDYLLPCLDFFGPERCMVSSNFPVEKAGVPYGTLWNMFKRLTQNRSENDRRLIFAESARRIYRLDKR